MHEIRYITAKGGEIISSSYTNGNSHTIVRTNTNKNFSRGWINFAFVIFLRFVSPRTTNNWEQWNTKYFWQWQKFSSFFGKIQGSFRLELSFLVVSLCWCWWATETTPDFSSKNSNGATKMRKQNYWLKFVYVVVVEH